MSELMPINEEEKKKTAMDSSQEMVTIEQKHLDALYFNIYSLQNRLKSIEETVAQNQIQNDQKMNEILNRLSSLKHGQQQSQNEHNKKKKKLKTNKNAQSDLHSQVICADDGSKWRRKKSPNPINRRMCLSVLHCMLLYVLFAHCLENGQIANEKTIHDLKQFPAKMVNSCKKSGILEFNQVQKKVMPDLCAGKDAFIVSPPGTGKTTAVILANVLRLNQSPRQTFSLFVAVDNIHVTYIRKQCNKLSHHFSNIFISPKQNKQRKSKKNEKTIHVCTPGRTLNLLQNVLDEPTKCKMHSLVIFDADAICIDLNLLDKVKKIFSYVPAQSAQSVSLQLVSNSYSLIMEKNMESILHDRYDNFNKHFCTFFSNDYFKYWKLKIDQSKKRMGELEKILEQNPFGCGIINCQNMKTAKMINEAIDGKYGSFVLNANYMNETRQMVEAFNGGSISYLITHKFSPSTYITECVAYDKLQMIINYEVKSVPMKRRCTVRKYQKEETDLHIISLFDSNEKKTILQIEENGIKMNPFNFEMWSSKHKNEVKSSMSSSVTTLSSKRSTFSSKSALNPFVAEFKPTPSPKKAESVSLSTVSKENERLQRYSGTKRILFGLIDEYLKNGDMNKIFDLNCCDMKIWGNVINDTLRDKDRSEIKMFNNLIVSLFNYKLLNNGESFQMSIVKYLVMMVDISVRKNPYFAQSVGELFATLCHFKHVNTNDSYVYFCKRYKEYSDNNKRGQKELLHTFILCSLQELERLHASQKLIAQVSKLLKQ